MAELKITLRKSLTGRKKKHIDTAHSFGLRRIGMETVQPDNEATRGKLSHIGYLVSVAEEGKNSRK